MRIPGGDRADGGLVKLWVENGILLVKANDADANSGACCPEYTVTTRYRVTGSKLTEVGKDTARRFTKKNDYPLTKEHPERLSGSSSRVTTTSTTRISAAAGQSPFVRRMWTGQIPDCWAIRTRHRVKTASPPSFRKKGLAHLKSPIILKVQRKSR